MMRIRKLPLQNRRTTMHTLAMLIHGVLMQFYPVCAVCFPLENNFSDANANESAGFYSTETYSIQYQARCFCIPCRTYTCRWRLTSFRAVPEKPCSNIEVFRWRNHFRTHDDTTVCHRECDKTLDQGWGEAGGFWLCSYYACGPALVACEIDQLSLGNKYGAGQIDGRGAGLIWVSRHKLIDVVHGDIERRQKTVDCGRT